MRDTSPCSQSLMGNEDRQSGQENTKPNPASLKTLKRTPFPLILALLYATITLFSWAVHCTLTHRPIGARNYNVDFHTSAGLNDYLKGERSFDKNERILRAARFCQGLASVLTIPLTSMVCSCAAVAFLQQRHKQDWRNTTLRQSMALADKGWNDPVLITKLMTGGWRRYGSIFLISAIILNIIGASISPLQGLFVSSKSVKVPTQQSSISLIDLPHWIEFAADSSRDISARMMQSTLLRSRLVSTGNTDPQFRLWSRGAACNSSTNGISQECADSGQYTFGSMPNISDPFWAQPPAGFETGLWQQFAPRINFTTKYEKISADEFPQDCKTRPGALYMHYANMTDNGGHIVDICMPANQSHSPWKATRDRQDFSEELYVKMTLDWKWGKYDHKYKRPFVSGNYSFRISLSTTAGYFELPNYQNGKIPGPLIDSLDDSLEQDCGEQCIVQSDSFVGDFQKRDLRETVTSKSDVIKALNHNNDLVSSVFNRGPLLNIVLVLFIERSYLDLSRTVPATYHLYDKPGKILEDSYTGGEGCVDILPMIKLLHGEKAGDPVSLTLDPCVASGGVEDSSPPRLGAEYLWLFAGEHEPFGPGGFWRSPSSRQIENAFTAAAFLAVDEWMQQTQRYGVPYSSWSLNWDMGVDQQIPSISHAGKILVSFLLGIYLFCILALSLYIAWKPRWTNQLDSFAMMRIGSSQTGQFPLKLVDNPDDVRALDKLPGWIGSTRGGKIDNTEYAYSLDLGGKESLKRKRKYHSYTTEDDSEK